MREVYTTKERIEELKKGHKRCYVVSRHFFKRNLFQKEEKIIFLAKNEIMIAINLLQHRLF